MDQLFLSNKEIKLLSEEVVDLILTGNEAEVIKILKPVLDSKCSFSKLDLLGKEIGKIGANQSQKFFKVFDKIIDYNAMGGFVIVGSALIYFLENNFDEVMKKSCCYIIKGNEWYVCDIIGERSLGHALVGYFNKTLPLLRKFLEDENRWIRRSTGVAIHFFSKRVLDEPEKTKELLKLVEPHIEERQIDVVKGIGWGLKTIGKYHPDILTEFLKNQLTLGKHISKLMMKKAITYLDKNKKLEVKSYDL